MPHSKEHARNNSNEETVYQEIGGVKGNSKGSEDPQDQ